MTRSSFIKSLVGLFLAPKILSEINIVSTKQAIIGSKGIIPTIIEGGNVVEYIPGNFSIENFHKLISAMQTRK